MAKAAIITDSMLSQMDDFQQHYFKTSLKLESLHIYPFPGKTANFILTDPFIIRLLEQNQFDFVFIAAGQNDTSKSLSAESIISGKSAEFIATNIMNGLTPTILSMTAAFPNTSFVFLPLTLRVPCKKKKTRFPQSKNPDYICKINEILASLVTQLLELHIPNFLFVEGPKLWNDPETLLHADGIHMTEAGIEEYLILSLTEMKRHFNV